MRIRFGRICQINSICIAVLALILGGCTQPHSGQDDQGFRPMKQKADPVAPLVLRSVGYGAYPEHAKHLSQAQKRLMAIRASRLDAYRSMAERVYGMSLRGNTTIRDMVAKNDGFKTAIDAFIHGARVVSAEVMPDGSVETILEMVIDSGFRNCIKTSQNGRFNVDCQAPMTSDSTRDMDMERARITSQGATPSTSTYYVQ